MSAALRTVFLSCFLLYSVSPLSYAQTDEGFIHFSHSENRLTNLRLFLLEHLFNTVQGQDSTESASDNVLLRKKRVLTASMPNGKLLPKAYSLHAYITEPAAVAGHAAVIERNTLVIRPQEILSLYSSNLSPPLH